MWDLTIRCNISDVPLTYGAPAQIEHSVLLEVTAGLAYRKYHYFPGIATNKNERKPKTLIYNIKF